LKNKTLFCIKKSDIHYIKECPINLSCDFTKAIILQVQVQLPVQVQVQVLQCLQVQAEQRGLQL
jgi:hypothetical protein